MIGSGNVPDFDRMQAFVVALAESHALTDSKLRVKPLTRGALDPAKLSERASLAIASARAEQRTYCGVFDVLPTPAILSDRRGRVRVANHAARQWFDRPGARLVGRPIQALFDEAAAARLGHALAQIDRSPTTLRVRVVSPVDGCMEVRCAAVGEGDVLWTLAPEGSEREALLARRLADKEDVIEHQRTKIEALDRESCAKDKFIAILGHDLRAPLNAILGWTQLLRREPLDATGRERALATIERNARSQAALIEELLDVTRMNEGKLALEISACDVALVVCRAIEAASPDAAKLGVHLRSRIEASSAEASVAGDRTRIEQIVTNLVANALKFTPAGGSIEVAVTREGESVCVEVRDTGKGIAPEDLPHVFRWLRQGGDGPPTREGLGLGLFIVRRLAELHGGSVEAASEGEGCGATFRVSLPCCDGGGLPVSTSDVLPDSLGELDGVEVLVVEDETDAVELLARVLATRGARVASARDATSALALALPRRPDVVVTDLGLPDMDGHELARRLRSEHGRTIGIVALSGFTANDGEPTADFDERLMKPVDIPRLVRAVREAASAARACAGDARGGGAGSLTSPGHRS